MKNFRKHKQRSRGFTTIPNDIFKDKRLSLKGKGLLCQLLSLPDDWTYSEKGLTQIMKDGSTSLRSAIEELESCFYLHRERVRDEKGHLKGVVVDRINFKVHHLTIAGISATKSCHGV